MKEDFFTAFPVPRMLMFPSVGLDITDRRVRVLGLEKKDNITRVAKYGEVAVPPGVIVGGTIKRPVDFSSILQSVARKHSITHARVSLPEERAYIVHMDIPRVHDDEMLDTIASQLEEYVPLKPEDTVFDYSQIQSRESIGTALVAVMPRDVVEVYVDVLSSAGIIPLSLEIESQAIARAVIPAEQQEGTHMIVDIGGTRMGVSVVDRGVVRFASTVDIGSEAFTDALTRCLNIHKQEADKKKNTHSIGGSDESFTRAIAEPLEKLSGEIEKLYLYWQTYHLEEKNEQPITTILLCGGGANLRGLAEYIERRLNVVVRVSNPWVNICDFDVYTPPIPRSDSFGYATAIGLALSGW
jgi:type IV pilus assembly protein PilM